MNKSVCIGIVTNGLVHVETMFSIIQAIKSLTIPSSMVIITGCYVDRNRNELVEKAIQTGTTHLMMIDTDMVFEKEAINILLSHDKDIVGANYNKRQFPITRIVKEDIKDIAKVEFVPAGFVLLNLDIFKTIPSPWFKIEYNKDNSIIDDDKYFSRLAKQYNIDTWCDPKIVIKHIGQFLF